MTVTVGPTGDDFLGIGKLVALPVCCRIQVLSRSQHAAFGRIADVHRMMLQREAQEGTILFDETFVVDTSGRHREDDEVIDDRRWVRWLLDGVMLAVTVQRVRHRNSAVTFPSPKLVFPRYVG